MNSELDIVKLENRALWALIQTLLRTLAARAPQDVDQFIKELEKLK